MKLILKQVFLCLLTIFITSCRENPQVKAVRDQPVTSYRNEASRQRENIDPPGEFRVRTPDAPPYDRDEIRRQRNLERTANIAWIKEKVQKYSPGSWFMLMEYDKLPESAEIATTDDGIAYTLKSAGTFFYLRGRSRIDLLASMETNVHEIAHAYFDQNVFRYLKENELQMNTDNAQGYIYLSPSQSLYLTFARKAMFPSGELATEIPDELRTYRFETYINGRTSTQSDGVIGLLNEMNAYYLGSEYCFNMLEPYKEAAGSDASGLFEWVTHTQSTMSAFYEFDFFIKEYLLHMKNEYLAEYNQLRSSRSFPEAYRTLHKLYTDLIGSYQDRIKKEMESLNSSGEATVGTEKGWLWVKAGNSHVSSGAPIFSEDRETLLQVLESRRYREIDKDFPVK